MGHTVELHVWYESESETEFDKEALESFGKRLITRFRGTPNAVRFEVVTLDVPDTINYHYCEWCRGENSCRFGSTEEYSDHLHEVHPDEAW